MMPPITTSVAVAQRVDVDLDRVVQEAVEQHRRIVRDLDRLAHVALEIALLVDDLHRAAAQHVRRAARPADSRSRRPRRSPPASVRAVRFGGCRSSSRCSICWKRSRSSAMSIMSGDVPMIGTPLLLEVARELERRLPAVLDDDAVRLLDVDDLEHVLERQRLEVQAVGGVVVGRHGLRIAVDHDRLVAVLAQRHRRVHAAVVELDPLPDPVRARRPARSPSCGRSAAASHSSS